MTWAISSFWASSARLLLGLLQHAGQPQPVLGAVQGHADQGGALLQEGGVGIGKRLKGAHFQHAFQFIVVKNRQHHDVARRGVAGAGAHQHVLLGHLLENNGFLFQRALPDQGFAQTELVGQLLAPLHGVGAGQAQRFALGVEGIEGADLGLQGGHDVGKKIIAQLFDAQIAAHQGIELGELVFSCSWRRSSSVRALRVSRILRMARIRWPVSSRLSLRISVSQLPLAMLSAAPMASSRGG